MSTAAHAPNCPTLSSFSLPGATPNPACCCGVTPYSCRIPRLWATDSQQRDPGPSLRRGRTHCHAPHHPNAHVRTVRAAHARAARAARAAPSRVPLPRRRDTTATCDQARAHRHASKVRVWRARGVFGLRHPFKNTPEWSPVSDRMLTTTKSWSFEAELAGGCGRWASDGARVRRVTPRGPSLLARFTRSPMTSAASSAGHWRQMPVSYTHLTLPTKA